MDLFVCLLVSLLVCLTVCLFPSLCVQWLGDSLAVGLWYKYSKGQAIDQSCTLVRTYSKLSQYV